MTIVGRVGQALRRLRGDKAWRHTRRMNTESVREYMHRLAAEYTGASGTLCWKTMWNQYRDVLLSHGLDAGAWNLPVTWIRIQRLDRVRQAVSLARSLQSGQWLASQPVIAEPIYDAALIARCEKSIAKQEAGWDRHFAKHAITPITVTYESLTTAYDATVKGVLVALGHPDIDPPPPQLQRQADALSDAWVNRYVREQS